MDCVILRLLYSLQLRAGIDDPLDSSAVHLVNGLLGELLLSFMAKPQHVEMLTGSLCGGIFYTKSGWLQLGMQVLGEYRAVYKRRYLTKIACAWCCQCNMFVGKQKLCI